ncbi:MAG: hypothetical protein EBS89_14445 [Proteobacteria bacterium]|jgi:hypothetical protein|nr:hypothetical protein [Pseudomonadota bacterium]
MGWLSVTDQQRDAVSDLNSTSNGVRVNVVRGTEGGWLANADALADAVPGGPLEQFAAWYASLTPTDDVPAPRPPRPRR